MPRAKPVRQVHRFVQRRESRARRVLSRGEGGPAKSQFRKVASFGAAASRGAAGRRLAARVGANVCPIAGSMCCHGGAPRPPACPAPPGATAGLREDHPSRGSTRDLALKLARARHGASGAPPRREGACLRSGPETQLGGHVENGGLSTLDSVTPEVSYWGAQPCRILSSLKTPQCLRGVLSRRSTLRSRRRRRWPTLARRRSATSSSTSRSDLMESRWMASTWTTARASRSKVRPPRFAVRRLAHARGRRRRGVGAWGLTHPVARARAVARPRVLFARRH